MLKLNSWLGFMIAGGTPLLMLIVFFFFGYDYSTVFVVLTKLTLLMLLTGLYLKNGISQSKGVIFYLVILFWILWFLRILYDSFINTKLELMLKTTDYFLFSIFFALIPFFLGNIIKSDSAIMQVKTGFIFGIIAFCIVVILLYYDTLSNMRRLGVQDNSVNPLVISYLGTMLCGYYLLKIYIEKFRWRYIFFIILSIPVIGFGASKGAIIGLGISLFIILFALGRLNFRILVLLIIGYVVIINGSLFFLEVLIDRFAVSLESNTYGEKELRFHLWKYSVTKFIENPFLGYFTEIDYKSFDYYRISTYPHNIILESFLSMGIIGGITMLFIIFITMRNGFVISKINKNESWLLLMFLISLYQNMFSGNIYSGALWFWFTVGLINGRFIYYLKDYYESQNA